MASQLGGAMDPPEGVQPNFINPPSLQQSNLIQHATCLSIIFVFVSMRIYTRLRILRVNLGVDDYLCLLAYAFDLAYSMLMIKACAEGLGRHMWDLPAAKVPEALKYLTISAWVYVLASGAIKLTFLFTYRGIFSVQSTIKTLIHVGIAFVTCVTLSLFFSMVFSCSPTPKAWNALLPGTCNSVLALSWASAILSSVADIYIWVLPIIPLWRLNLSLEKRLRMMIAFSFGFIACIASLVRLGMTRILQSSPDASYTTAAIGKWSALEIDVGLICSCLMLLPAFTKYHMPETWRAYLSSRLSRLSASSSHSWRVSKYHSTNGKYQHTNDKKVTTKPGTQIIMTTEFKTESSQTSIELIDQGGLLSESPVKLSV